MLTTSPIISSSSNNASPRSFGVQYGSTTRSPHQQGSLRRPGPGPGSLPRRQSSMSHQQSSAARGSVSSPVPQNQILSQTSPAISAAPEGGTSRDSDTHGGSTQRSTVPNPSADPEPVAPLPPTPPGPRPLDDAQSQHQTVRVAGFLVVASSTTSPPKRSNPTDEDEDRGRGSEAGPSTRPAQRPRQSATPPKRLPARYEFCSVDDMVILISHMLVELIETNDNLALRPHSLTRFHSRTAPGISVLDYLNRLAKHATLTPPLLLSMVYYIDRLCALYPQFTINTLTVHRFLITAAAVAAKGLSDSFWNNTTYAKVGGVKVQELNLLELEFLYRVDWKIVPNPEVLVAYYKGLIERHPGYELMQDPADPPNQDETPTHDEDELGETDSDEISDDSPGPTDSAPASVPE